MGESLEPIEKRQILFELNKSRLEQIAFNATQKGMNPNQFVVVAIDVDDPVWTELVDYLMPGFDWNAIRAKGEKPIARGSVRSEITDYIGEVVPTIAPALTNELPQGIVKGIVMGSGGASVYPILPNSHVELN